MINVEILDVKPHPCQATHNPGCWAVQFRVTYAGKSKKFWRWHTVRRFNTNGTLIKPNAAAPSSTEILANFWDCAYGDLHGFNFEEN